MLQITKNEDVYNFFHRKIAQAKYFTTITLLNIRKWNNRFGVNKIFDVFERSILLTNNAAFI